MIVLQVTTTIPRGDGRVLAFPIGVAEDSLDAFGERLSREGGLLVDKLMLDRRSDGYAYITSSERLFLSLAGVATIRDHNCPVRFEVD